MSAMAKAEKNLRVVSCFATDAAGNELPVVVLAAAEPGAPLRLDEPWQRELARDLEWHYRPPYVPVEDGE